MKAKVQLGQLLLEKGLITQAQLTEVLRIQVSGNRRLGHLLIKMGVLTDEQLMKTLGEQLDIPIVNIDEEIAPDTKKLIPRYLCERYSFLPLRKKEHNVLFTAMADPLDKEAIAAIENYTNLVVEAGLAKHKDIDASIKRYVPLSLQDFFNPQSFGLVAKTATAVMLVLLLTLAVFASRYVYQEKYGTVSTTMDAVIYKNHDLLIMVNANNNISLLGHGARAKGHYSVTFDNIDAFKNFVSKKENDFSNKQLEWIRWLTEKKITQTHQI